MSKLRLGIVLAVALGAALAGAVAQATPPGKNGLILFARHAGGYEQLFTMRPEGTQVRQVTHLTDSAAADASWSPDGKRIAFARDFDCCDPKKEHLDIYTMNANGTALHGMGLKGLNGGPLWFPDGRRLLFGHASGIWDGLWAVSASGGTPQRVLRIVGDFEGQSLSPSGRDVAFINKGALVIANLASGRRKQVAPSSLHPSPKIDWSPDGTLVLSRTEAGAVFTVRTDGSELKMLVRGKDYCSESFSPDGTKILFIDHCSSGGAGARLFAMNLDGTEVKRIATINGHWVSWGVGAG
jgi:TolB protein